MYHDEFASKRSGRPSSAEEMAGTLAIEVGGGVSAAVTASIAFPELPALLSIGGLLPWLLCCAGILLDRVPGAAADLLKAIDAGLLGKPIATIPAIGSRPVLAFRDGRVGVGRTPGSRAGFDRSRRLG